MLAGAIIFGAGVLLLVLAVFWITKPKGIDYDDLVETSVSVFLGGGGAGLVVVGALLTLVGYLAGL